MPLWLIPVGRMFYAIGLIGIGIQHLIFVDFIPVMVPAWPSTIPGRPILACAAGVALIACGISIFFNLRARAVAAWLGAAILALVICAHIPVQLAAYPAHLGVWTNAFKALTFCGGAWIIACSLDDKRSRVPESLQALLPLGRFFLPITCVAFGLDHFLYPEFVAGLVPRWIPGPAFWSYFAGVALIAAGVGMILRIQSRLASLLLGVMIFLWFLILHIPRAIADPSSAKGNEWTSVWEALAFSGIAFILATLPGSNPAAIASRD